MIVKSLTLDEAQAILKEAKTLVERVELCYGKEAIVDTPRDWKLVNKMIEIENHIEQVRSDLEGIYNDKPA